MKGWRGLLIGLLFSVFTLWIALRGNDIGAIQAALATANWWFIVPTSLLFALGLITRGFRWRILLNDRITTMHALHIMNIGYFLGVVLPFRLGEVARAFLTTRLDPPIPVLTSIGSIVIERLIDLLTVAVMIALAVSIAPVPASVSAAALTSGILTVVGLIVLVFLSIRRGIAYSLLNFVTRMLPFLTRLNPRMLLDRVLDGLTPLSSPQKLVRLLFWNVLSWFTSVAAAFALLYMFFPNPTWFAAILLITVASLAVAIPALPGNVGPFEAAVITGLSISGLVNLSQPDQAGRAFAYAVILHLFNILSYIVGGLIGLRVERISMGDLIRSVRGRNPEASETPTESTPESIPESDPAPAPGT